MKSQDWYVQNVARIVARYMVDAWENGYEIEQRQATMDPHWCVIMDAMRHPGPRTRAVDDAAYALLSMVCDWRETDLRHHGIRASV